MRSILGIFGRSPFVPIKSHMEVIASCFDLVKNELQAVEKEEFERIVAIADDINYKQNTADAIRREISNNLSSSLFLAIDKTSLLDILKIQSKIAERCYDIGIIMTHKKTQLPDFLEKDFKEYFESVSKTFKGAEKVIYELNDLLESSFGGLEAEKVKQIIDTVGFQLNEGEKLKRRLLSLLLNAGEKLSYSDFYVWEKCIRYLSGVAHLSMHLAFRLRTSLDLK